MKSLRTISAIAIALVGIAPLRAQSPLLWPEEERAFFQDGPAWLLPEPERDAVAAAGPERRSELIRGFLAKDPDPSTPENELLQAISLRRDLVARNLLTFLDERARILFLRGEPDRRELISCDQTFVPMEIWYYGNDRGSVLYEPEPGKPYKLWLPLDSKRPLYGREMSYWLQQVAELRGAVRGPRFDRALCKQTKLVDDATGVRGLFGYDTDRPTNATVLAIFNPPPNLAAWAQDAIATTAESAVTPLRTGAPSVHFPDKNGERMLTRILVEVPVEAGLRPFQENDKTELRVKVDGAIERQGELFEEFHTRFQVPVLEDQIVPVALVVDQLLRSDEVFLVRLRISDEIGGAVAHRNIGFRVPEEPEAAEDLPEGLRLATGTAIEPEVVEGVDSLILIPPETDVVLGLWRAETLMSGRNIRKVVFSVDGQAQLTRSRPPYSAELRLSKFPTEQVVRAEGFDERDELIAWDEVVLNQQRGQLEIRIANPKKGAEVHGRVTARAHVVVPDEKHVEKVEFLVDDEISATLDKPPWEAEVRVPDSGSANEVHYLTAAVSLDDGTRAEDVMFLNQPEFVEEVEVDFVELYTSVDGDTTRSLVADDFSVFEDGRPQVVQRFELVENLPLTIGIVLDTSGSMIEALGEAKRSAIDFLDNIITPRDQSFALTFATRPYLVMPRTSDVGAVKVALDDLRAVGNTALHDAVVNGLYYFRGVRGQRALVVLSDGEDTSSTIEFKDALEYAKRSGVVIYTIGLNIPRLSIGVRGKLSDLSRVTGGQSFFITRASELENVYEAIEKELRSKYLLAYLSDAPPNSEEFREVEVKVKGRLKARTISGYYP